MQALCGNRIHERHKWHMVDVTRGWLVVEWCALRSMDGSYRILPPPYEKRPSINGWMNGWKGSRGNDPKSVRASAGL